MYSYGIKRWSPILRHWIWPSARVGSYRLIPSSELWVCGTSTHLHVYLSSGFEFATHRVVFSHLYVILRIDFAFFTFRKVYCGYVTARIIMIIALTMFFFFFSKMAERWPKSFKISQGLTLVWGIFLFPILIYFFDFIYRRRFLSIFRACQLILVAIMVSKFFSEDFPSIEGISEIFFSKKSSTFTYFMFWFRKKLSLLFSKLFEKERTTTAVWFRGGVTLWPTLWKPPARQ